MLVRGSCGIRIAHRRWCQGVVLLGGAALLVLWNARALLGDNWDSGSADRLTLQKDVHQRDHVWQADAPSRRLQAVSVNCTPPAIEQFPRGIFSQEQRQQGAVLLHIITAVYMFVALALVCDDYFVPSLEVLCDILNLQTDVAGATFMAAGSSAPELATSVIAVFIAKDDIGLGTVVGSAVYNVTFVISICALFATTVLYLNWWPLVRDCIFYALSVIALVLVIFDEMVTWYEALALILLYIFYIIIMCYNLRLEAWAHSKIARGRRKVDTEEDVLYEKVTSNHGNSSGAISMTTMGSSHVTENSDGCIDGAANHSRNSNLKVVDSETDSEEDAADTTVLIHGSPSHSQEDKNQEDPASPLSIPQGSCKRVLWVITLPISILLFITMLDCRKKKFRKWFMVTFIMSLIWLSVFSYLIVWMITTIGHTLGIPDTIMSLTFIAFGVSVPDAISSLIVVREGYGDMGVSNAVGSNIFDILICLGVPWLLETAVHNPGTVVQVYSEGLTYSSITLLSTVAFLLIATHLNGWKLDKLYGAILMVVYLIFMVLASLYELNIFGYFHPPECPTDF